MKDFEQIAIMLIYPDGEIDFLPIDENALHIRYYLRLSEVSPIFAEILEKNDFHILNKKGEIITLFTNPLDTLLASLGIITIRNGHILEIKSDKDFLKNNTPTFYFTIPEEFTLRQKEILRSIFEVYEGNRGTYFKYSNNDLEDCSYEEIVERTQIQKTM